MSWSQSRWIAPFIHFRIVRASPAIFAAIILTASPVPAATLTWDSGNTNNGSTIDPGNGVWDTTPGNLVWNNAGVNQSWTNGAAAVFGGADGTYSVKVGESVSASTLAFDNSGYVLSASGPQTITAGSTPFLLVNPGKIATVGTNVTVSVGIAATTSFGSPGGSPGGTVIIDNGGVVQETANKVLVIGGSGTVVSLKTGGILKCTSTSSGTQGISVGATVGDSPVLSVDGGTLSIARNTASFWIPNALNSPSSGDVEGTLTLNSGTVSTTGGFVSLGAVAGNLGVLNLNGGTLIASAITGGTATGTPGAGTSIVNFNGGILRAQSGNSVSLVGPVTAACVRNGGAVIDNNGFTLNFSQPLLHSTNAADNVTDGGLTCLGTGSVALAGTNTFTGPTLVSGGSLLLEGSILGPVTVSETGTLSGGPSIGPITISNNLTLRGTLVMKIGKNPAMNDVIQGVSNLVYGGVLELNLTNGALALGDKFTLFHAGSYGGSFAQIITVPPLTNTLSFDTTGLLTDGTLRVVAPVLNGTFLPNGLNLSWQSASLYQYQLLAATNLATPRTAWNVFGPVTLGDGTVLSQNVPLASLPQEFFRLTATPLQMDVLRLPVQLWKNTQWVDPGGWTTIDVTTQGLPANDTNIDAAVQVANIVKSTSGRRRLYFPTGVYSFQSSLTINNTGDLWVDGDGSSNTVFRIDAPASADAEIAFHGSTSGGAIPVLGSPLAGDISVTVTNAGTLNVGDLIQLYANNAPLVQGGLSFVTHVYGQMFQITAKNGNTLTLDMKILLDYPASYAPLVQRYNQIRNIKVSHVLISRVNQPLDQDVSNLEFYDAYNCCVVQLESNFSQRHHVYFQNSKDCVIESNFVHDTWNHTTGGYGYGYGLVGSTGCRISNNKSTRLRHHIILQIGANYNVAGYNSIEECYDYNDMALHASYAYLNLFEGNMCQQSYADTSKDGATDAEPSTGPGNTWFRNYVTQEVGCEQSQTVRQNVIGNDAGSILSSGSDHYIGANLVASNQFTFGSFWPGGVTNWGVFPTNVVLPASLYLASRPDFLGAGTPWPLFGPGVPNWGITNLVPARIANPVGL